MHRQLKKEITLSDGNFIPKNTFIAIGPVLTKDPSTFPNPDKFDGGRFLRLRNTPGCGNKHQFVTTSPECIVFGHGYHACPGRFFASNEIKILLAHMLMYYDWKLPDGQTKVQHIMDGVIMRPNPLQTLLFKSRRPEVDLTA
jgi:cytochrome P450